MQRICRCVRSHRFYLRACSTSIKQLHTQHPPSHEISAGIKKEEYIQRRVAFFQALPDNCIAILPGANRQTRTNDILWPFRQESNMWFLTGFDEPNAVALFCKNSASNSNTFFLFCEESTPHSELWHGPCIGTQRAVDEFGADMAYARERFTAEVQQIFASNCRSKLSEVTNSPIITANVPLFYAEGTNPKIDAFIKSWLASGSGPASRSSVTPIMNALKVRKTQQMQNMLQKSADITTAMFRAGMQRTAPGENERSIQAVMDFVAQNNGACGFAYVPVIAGGTNALSLHYIRNNTVLKANELLMVDAGAEYQYYPTDCTRAWPISGKFTETQRVLYEAVLRVQKALVTRVIPGQRISEMQRLSEEMLLEEMKRVGVISKDAPLPRQKELLGVIYPHSWGHPMGIDIHEWYPPQLTAFREGMMHTVEPGVYIPQDDRFPTRFQGIGFRIEDNVIVAKDELGDKMNAPIVTTGKIPKEVEEIEEVMRSASGRVVCDRMWDGFL